VLSDNQTSGVCELGLRDVLIFNNIILGQRSDPTRTFLRNSFLPQPPKGEPARIRPLPLKPIGNDLFDTTRGLVDISVGGLFDGSAGIRIFSNAVGRRVTQKLFIQDADWTSKWKPTAVQSVGPGNVLEVLQEMTDWFFSTFNADPNFPASQMGQLELPHWAMLGSVGSKNVLHANPRDPFDTDWAVKLSRVFNSNAASYRWASVDDLNWEQAAFKLGPIGGENCTVCLPSKTLTVDDGETDNANRAQVSHTASVGSGLMSGPWLPESLPNFDIYSSVWFFLPAEIELGKFSHVTSYLLNAMPTGSNDKTLDIVKQYLPNGVNFKGARKP